MGFIQIILLIFKYGPSVFTLVKEIYDMIKGGNLQSFEVAGAEMDFETAIKEYKATKNRMPLRRLRDRLNKRCYGDKCDFVS